MQISSPLVKLIQALSIGLTLLAASPSYSCTKRPEYAAALEYLQTRRPLEAQKLLDILLAACPNDPQIKMRMASVYVLYSGFELATHFVPIAKKMHRNFEYAEIARRENQQAFYNLQALAANRNGAIDSAQLVKVWQDISEVTEGLVYINQFLRDIPLIEPWQYENLTYANTYYQEAIFALSPGESVPAAMVQLLLVRYRLQYELYFPKVEMTSPEMAVYGAYMSLEALQQDIIMLFEYIQHFTGQQISYAQDFREDWDRMQSKLLEHNLELGLIMTAINRL